MTNSMQPSPSREADSCLASTRNSPAFYGNQMFAAVFTTTRHLSLSPARSIQSTPYHRVCLKYILILPSHPHRGLPSGLFPSGSPNKNRPCLSFLSYTCHMPCQSHPPRFYHPSTTW